MIFRCRSTAPRPVSTSARARRPISTARSGSPSRPPKPHVRLSPLLTRSAPPPAISRSTTSRAFSVCGPTMIGRPARAGSSTLCPPTGHEAAADERGEAERVAVLQRADRVEQDRRPARASSSARSRAAVSSL